MPDKNFLERHSLLANTVLMLLVTAVTLVALEFGFRIGRDLMRGSSWLARAENIDDSELGWVLNPDKQNVTKSNACGETVVRLPPASKYLNKRPRYKDGMPVLFLGDSFTQGTETSSTGLYYEIFESLGAGAYAVSAAGVGGYNTAQQYVLLNKVFDTVKPRVVFWQMSTNDVEENVYIGTDISTVQKPRLYFDPKSNSFVKRNPATWLLQQSDLARYLYGELMKIDRSYDFGIALAIAWVTESRARPPAEEVERRGREVARLLIGRAIKERSGTVFIGFAADPLREQDYRAMFEEQGGLFVADLAKAMRKVSAARLDCSPVDPHWNHEGNRVAGELLLQFVKGDPAAALLQRN